MRRMNRLQRHAPLLLLAIQCSLLTQCGGESAHHKGATPAALPFIQDDYSQALMQARERKLPLFIDAWAPW